MGKVLVINNADFSGVSVKKVTFQQGSWINVSASLSEADSLVSGDGFYAVGQTATITATSNRFYTFVKWSDGNTNAQRTVTITDEGTLNYIAEYTSNIVRPNNFIWGNGGIMEPTKSSGSLNTTASIITKLIHTTSECLFRINKDYLDDFSFGGYSYKDSLPESKTQSWQEQGGTNVSYTGDNTHKELTLQSGLYLQLAIKNISGVNFTSDLSACQNIVEYVGGLELVEI